MNQPTTKFTEAYGYGLIVLWISVLVILMLYFSISGWPDFLSAIGTALVFQLYLTIFGFPVAAVASFVIGGGIWRVLKGIIPNNTIRASLGGGVTGASVISFFDFIVFGEFQKDLLTASFTVFAVFLLGVWCGWAGEKLASLY